MDQSKKTMRHFYCRDVLWGTFEQMAADFDCSIDYLVNEAMRYYARSKNYQTVATGIGPASAPAAEKDTATEAQAPLEPPRPTIPLRHAKPTLPPPAPRLAPKKEGGGHPELATPVAVAAVERRPTNPPAAPRAKPTLPPPLPRVATEATAAPATATAPAGTPLLYLSFNDQVYTIDKDQFIIGRGSKSSDLPIKDGNISRKHAAVIRRNGVYYIKDLGSTNGIDYKGMRIDNKRIDEGDIFHLCDYELRFTYRS